MAHTFPYQTIGNSKLPRPFIPLTLRYNNKTVKIKALVDSGADFCMFDGELLNLLDPNLDLNTRCHRESWIFRTFGMASNIFI